MTTHKHVERVIRISGAFTGDQKFYGTVDIEDQTGERRTITGEHSRHNYDWGKFWPADEDFEECPESPEIVDFDEETDTDELN
jgi:hypothetical protein